MVAKKRSKTAEELYYHYVPPKIPLAAIRRFARRIAERFDPVCGTPGDSGGCEMGLAADTMAVIPGILLGILVGVVLGLRSSSRPKS